MVDVSTLEPGERDAVLDLIAEQQADPTRRAIAVGLEREGIAAELDELEPPWETTARVVRRDGAVTGVGIVEWDPELGRAWIVGPWVRGDGDAWLVAARALADAVGAQVPDGIEQLELAGESVADGLASVASGLGLIAGEANHVLVADRAIVDAWPAEVRGDVAVRPATTDDVGAIAPMHELEFPATYASAEKLVADGSSGDRTTIVATGPDGTVWGYASGQVHGDGEAFIDFVGVDPSRRRHGVGAALMRSLGRTLLDASSMGQVALTVQDHREPARAMYERLGFRPDGVFVAYRSWT